jgi:hypothetical protein
MICDVCLLNKLRDLHFLVCSLILRRDRLADVNLLSPTRVVPESILPADAHEMFKSQLSCKEQTSHQSCDGRYASRSSTMQAHALMLDFVCQDDRSWANSENPHRCLSRCGKLDPEKIPPANSFFLPQFHASYRIGFPRIHSPSQDLTSSTSNPELLRWQTIATNRRVARIND